MAVNPLVAYTDMVNGSTNEDPADAVGGSSPVGLLSEDPFDLEPPSQALWDELHPPQPIEAPDDGGDFNPDANLDPSQVIQGVPLDLPGMPGYMPPPPSLQTESWRDSVSGIIDGVGEMGEKLTDMFPGDQPRAEIPMDQNTIGLPEKVSPSTTGQVPSLGDFTDPNAVPQSKPTDKGTYITDDPAARNKIVGLARAFVGAGTPYAYGGNSLVGASREGMVQAAYGYAGVQDMSALAGELADRGDEVPVNKLKEGDLVTWQGTQGHLFGHDRVGIFVGNGQIITATQKNGFHVMNLGSLPGSANGIRVRRDSGHSTGGVSFASSESSAGAAQEAAQATVDAVKNIFDFDKKKQDQKKKDDAKGGGKKSGGGKGWPTHGSSDPDKNGMNNYKNHAGSIGATK